MPEVLKLLDPSLLFKMSLPTAPVKTLVTGKLVAKTTQTQVAYAATSGAPRFQCKEGECWKGRGQLPAPRSVGIPHYTVSLEPIYMPQVKGVEGNFYQITPFWVLVKDVRRGDFGIHEDKNAPGSAACIVITMPNHWKQLELWFKTLRGAGYKTIPLYVEYDYA